MHRVLHQTHVVHCALPVQRTASQYPQNHFINTVESP